MKNKSAIWLVLFIAAALVLCCGGCMLLSLFTARSSGTGSGLAGGPGNGIAVIEVKGVIASGAGAGGVPQYGTVYADDVIQHVQRATGDASIGAIVLDINSPGGSVVGSVDIYRALRSSHKPIVASMGEVAASGGYYIACAAQRILARSATTTGSIGVIWQFTNAEELLRKLGVDTQIVASGEHKDEGGWHRPLDEEELAIYQSIVDQAYEDFLQVIVDNRDLPADRVRSLADGRIFSGRQALSLGLVDAEGNLDDAIEVAAQLGGIEGEPRILRFGRNPTFFDLFIGAMTRTDRPKELVLLQELLGDGGVPRLQYLYTGP